MSEERKRILEMLAEGKVSVDEAERLMAAMEKPHPETTADHGGNGESGTKPKFLHVKLESGPNSGRRHENVDIKIPIVLLKAGVKLGSLMSEKARGKFTSHLSDHGLDIDLKDLDGEKLNVLIKALTESSIDIDADDEKMRIFCA